MPSAPRRTRSQQPAQQRATGTGGVGFSANAAGIVGRDFRPDHVYGRIIGGPENSYGCDCDDGYEGGYGYAGGYAYQWQQVVPVLDSDGAWTGCWEDVEEGYGESGEQSLHPAYEVNGREDIPTDGTFVARMLPLHGAWEFSASGIGGGFGSPFELLRITGPAVDGEFPAEAFHIEYDAGDPIEVVTGSGVFRPAREADAASIVAVVTAETVAYAIGKRSGPALDGETPLYVGLAALSSTSPPPPPPAFVGARVHRTGGINLVHSSNVTLDFNSERFDTDGFHAANAGGLIVPSGKGGYYQIGVNVRVFPTDEYRYVLLELILNGSVVIASQSDWMDTTTGTVATGVAPRLSVSTLWSLADGDEVTARLRQENRDAAAAETGFSSGGGCDACEFWLHKVG